MTISQLSNKLSIQQLSVLYNGVDCTINISDAEGFGLATLESLQQKLRLSLIDGWIARASY